MNSTPALTSTTPPFDDALIDQTLDKEESYHFDCKRLRDKLAKILETVVAFANSDGGTIALGLEDPDKGPARGVVPIVPGRECVELPIST